jgi:imidazolonepropionase-like amidohydrolase
VATSSIACCFGCTLLAQIKQQSTTSGICYFGASALGMEKEIGSIEVGKLADLVVINANPLENLQYLYGTGAVYLNEKNEVVRKGGVKYTIKDGIVYDAKKLLADVKAMVDASKKETGKSIKQPGIK